MALALVVACSNEPTEAPVQKDARAEVERFDLDRASFGSTVLDCKSGNQALAISAWDALRQALQKEPAPVLKEVGVKPAQFRDSSGSVVRISYTFEPGDPGVVSTGHDTLLVADTCQIALLPAE